MANLGIISRLRSFVHRPTVSPSRAATFLGLAIAFALGMMFRLQMGLYGYYLDEFDPYFHYYATSVIVNDLNTKGLAGLFDFYKVIDYQAWYPIGYNLATTTYSGFYYTSALLYEFFTRVLGVGISLYDYVIIQQAYLSTLMIVPVFLIGRKIYGNSAGIIAAMVAVITPGFISRADLGWYKHEPLSMLVGVFALYFIMESYDSHDRRKSLMWAMLAGLFLGYSNVDWGGGEYFNGIIGVSFFAVPLLLSADYNKAYNAIIAMVVDLSIGLAFANPGLGYLTNPSMFVMYLGAFGGLVVTAVAKNLPDRNKILGKWLATAGMAGLGAIAVFFGPFKNITSRYLTAIDPFARSITPAVQTVAEQQPTTGAQMLDYYTIFIFLAPLGGYFLLRRKKPYSIAVAIFFLSALYVASSFARLQVFVSVSIALVGAVALGELSGRIFSLTDPKNKSSSNSSVNLTKGFYAMIMIVLIVLSSAYVWFPFANKGYAITTAGTALTTSYIPDWLQALTWISQNTPQNAKIISWWDYGYWISVMGNRTTFIDNDTLNSTRMAEVATMFLSNVTTASKLVSDMGGNYVVVFLTLRQLGFGGYYTLGRVYSVGGDDGKFDAMATIARINLTSEGLLNPYNLMPTNSFFTNTTLGRMFPLSPQGYAEINPSTQQVVNIIPNYDPTAASTYIELPIYTLSQNFPPGSHPFELVYQSSGTPDSQGFIAQVFIYKYNPAPVSNVSSTNSSSTSAGT